MPLQKTTPEEIIRQSIQVFREKGYYHTTMNDLAKAAGMSKGVFYHHFTKKEDVMRKALQATTAWFNRKIFNLAYQDGLGDKEKLEQMSEFTFQAFVDKPGGCLFSNTILETSQIEETFIKEIKEFFGLWEKAFIHIFKNHYPEAELSEVIQQIIADIEGSIILMQLYKDTNILKKAIERTLKKI